MALINEQAARRQLETHRAELLGRLGVPADAPAAGVAPHAGRGLALRAHTLALLEQVEGALRQLDRGQYGLCQACGRMIQPERLEALPYTTQCVACSAKAASR